MKNFSTNERDREENQKITDIINEKTFQPGLKIGKKKPRLVEKRGICLRRDLVDEGLGQNKVLYSSSEVELPIVNYHSGSLVLPVSERQISNYLPASGSRIVLIRIFLCCLFLVTLFDTLFSASC